MAGCSHSTLLSLSMQVTAGVAKRDCRSQTVGPSVGCASDQASDSRPGLPHGQGGSTGVTFVV